MIKLSVGVLLGLLVFGAVRFAARPWPQQRHFHANWAIFVNGTPVDLSPTRYMQSVQVCAADDRMQPEQRVHMHNGEAGVVHIHDDGVAWGHLLQNLGFDLGADYLILDDGRRVLGDRERSLKFVLNGFVVSDVDNRLIMPGDRLLISYGTEAAETVVASQFPRVPSNASEYDQRSDPAGCAGARTESFWVRLRQAFWG